MYRQIINRFRIWTERFRPIKSVLWNPLCVLSKYEGEKYLCERNGDIFYMYDEYNHHHFPQKQRW